MSTDWEYRLTDEFLWASYRELDPYGETREVLVEREGHQANELQVRITHNERSSPLLACVGVPIEVVAEVLRRLGWVVNPPPKEPG